jgi:hypothetical protein
MAEQVDIGAQTAASEAGRTREHAVTAAFVSIANSLVQGYDIVDLYSGLTRSCVSVLDIGAAGLLLADRSGVLQVVTASSEAAHSLELFMLQSKEGPCLDCFVSGAAVAVDDLAAVAARWPHFVPAALAVGMRSVHALPMRLRGSMLGTLALFGTRSGPLSSDDLMLGQALAHVASVALVADRAAADKNLVNDQLQTALNSRIVLEQAKGIIAQLGGLAMEDAFAILRRYSRDHNRRLSDVAADVVGRVLSARLLIDHCRVKGVGRAEPPG